MTSSRGAWPFYYSLGLDRRSDPHGRDAYGIYSFKEELVFNGYGYGEINLTLALWGDKAVKATKQAQMAFAIGADGVLGPTTARCLFRKRMITSEIAYNIPNSILQRIASLESGNDPVAQGWADPKDEGIFQENLPSNPLLTQAQCWTPSVIISIAAKQLASRIQACSQSIKAGTAAWNVGNFYAEQWYNAGFPAEGGDNNVYARATNYVTLVNSQPL